MRDPNDRCASQHRDSVHRMTLRCVLRPHEVGDHVGLVREGDKDTPVERWSRTPVPAQREAAPQAPPGSVRATTRAPSRTEAIAQGFTGESCSKCGSLRVLRTGKCATCADCGETTSCG